MKTLIATDGSPEATAALTGASRFLNKENKVSVVCVAPEAPARTSKARSQNGHVKARERYRKRISKETDAILDAAQKVLAKDGIEAKRISQFGSPAGIIQQLSSDFDITVMGATGRKDRSLIGIGPVAGRIVEHGSGTVLVVREPPGEGSWRALVAVDGSEASLQALKVLKSYFDIAASEVTLIQVVETPWVHLGLSPDWVNYPDEVLDRIDPEVQLERELGREADAIVSAAEAELEGHPMELKSVIREGNPATEILGEADLGDYDLIVLGATGASDLKHQMLGSVSAKVAAQARCSVAVVRAAE